MIRKLLAICALLATITCVQAVASHHVVAAANGNGYRLSPVRTDLIISKGSSDHVTTYIQNASSAPEDLEVIVDDFEAPTNESGYPALLLNGATAPDHSLKQFTSIPDKEVVLQPGQQATVNVNISIPSSAASGGYYGAIRFAPITVGANGSRNVNLSASIASLVLVTVPGNLIEKLSVASLGVSQGKSTKTHSLFFNNKNLSARLRFDNTGNIQLQPLGNLILKKGSTQLDSFVTNDPQDPGNVLPNSIRLFTVKLDKVGWYGKYKLYGNFGYGSKGQLLYASTTFYVIPVLFIIIAILILLFIIFLIFGLPRLIRSYNRRIIAKVNQNRR